MTKFLSIIGISLVSVLIIIVPTSYALTATPTPAPTTAPTTKPTPKVSEDPKNINILNELKDKIASKVAQLDLVQKKGVIGTITAVSSTGVTLQDIHGNDVDLDVDELTKFSSPSAKSAFGISDLTKGAIIDVLGLYNKQSKHILARFITVVTLEKHVVGEVASIDTDNYLVNVISDDGTITPIDIESITKTYNYPKGGTLEKSGFSKIQQAEHIVVTGYQNSKDKRHILATRIILFPDVPANPRIIIPQQALSPDTTVVPSTGSGKKLTPITR